MLSTTGSLLQRIRVFGTRFFHRFGIHCATHQVRLIIISSIVISCLLFPAVSLYSSAQTTPFSLSFRVFDALLTPDDISTYFALEDLRNIWEGHDSLRTREDSTAKARCGKEGIVRVERIIVHDGFAMEEDDDDTPHTGVSHKLLQSTLQFETQLSEVLAAHRARCVQSPEGRCLVLSPLAFWDYDEDALKAEPKPHEVLGPGRNISMHGITVTSDMVLAGGEDGELDYNTTLYPVLTYYFPEGDCVANGGHHFWQKVIEEAASISGAEVIAVAKAPRLIALQHDKEITSSSRFSALQVFTYSAYLVFLVYFTRQMRRMDKVHSRVGLAVTGIVEIVVSTVTSLSVCALAGFRITMVPWEIFPIVVIFIGVENMFSIVDAVIRTSIALPVKERVAEGLSRAGTSNTLKLCTYNAVLGVMAFFSTGAIRQFCAFAIVVLVAHWFLVHTFFVTVLSIDIQRLELDELLRQGASLMPSHLPESSKPSSSAPQTKVGWLVTRVQHALRGRPAKNISLVLLLAVTATLYYMTHPYGSAKLDPGLSSNRGRFARPGKQANLEAAPPALQIWQTLNPANFDLVHLRIESPTIVVLSAEDVPSSDSRGERQYTLDEKVHRSRWARLWHRTSRPLTWAFNNILVPTFVTTTLLYGLLLYLLKDAELLEAQRNRRKAGTPEVDDAIPAVEDPVSFTTLPRAFATDVDLIAASADGNVVATIGVQNEFVLWRMDTKAYSAVDTSDLLLGSSGSSQTPASTLTAIGISDAGTYVAVGTGTGIIALWSFGQNRIQPMPHLNADTFSAVTNVQFVSNTPIVTGRSTPRRQSGAGSAANGDGLIDPPGFLYATYENGAVIRWDICSFAAPTYIKPSRSASVIKSMLLPVQSDGRLIIGFCLEDGSLELCDAEKSNGLLAHDTSILAGNPADIVDKVNICCVDLEGETRIVVGAATQAGVVSMWDAGTGECMRILEEPFGPINNLRIIPVPMKRCSTCRELPPQSFTLCFSFGQVVLFYRAYLGLSTTRRCSCPISQTKVITSVLGRRSRSSSVASVNNSPGSSSPLIVRSRMSSFSSSTAYDSATAYPVSVHGSHLRRASDKRNLDTYIPAEIDEMDGRLAVGPQDIPNGSPHLASGQNRTSLWENLVVTCIADSTFERGGWDVANNKIIGIRRKPRIPKAGEEKYKDSRRPPTHMPGRNDVASGLTPATLERWELWTFDPSESRLQASPLLALGEEVRPDRSKARPNGASVRNTTPRAGSGSKVVPRLHFTRVSPLFSSRSFCLAGFGNTVGLFNFHGGPSVRQRPPTPPNDFGR